MIAALAADQLEYIGVAAFHPAIHDARRLAPQVGGPAVAGLASKRERHAGVGVKAQPRVTGMARSARYRVGTRTARQLVTGHAGSPACSAVVATGHFIPSCRRASRARWP
jgi:hypothetical protein